MQSVTMYACGSCLGNPGPGGWFCILVYKSTNGTEVKRHLGDGNNLTTHNRMELMSVISGLEFLKYPCKVTIYTNSPLIANAVHKKWLHKWEKTGWKNASNEPVKNVDLWKRLLAAIMRNQVDIVFTKKNTDHMLFHKCHALAKETANGIKDSEQESCNIDKFIAEETPLLADVDTNCVVDIGDSTITDKFDARKKAEIDQILAEIKSRFTRTPTEKELINALAEVCYNQKCTIINLQESAKKFNMIEDKYQKLVDVMVNILDKNSIKV